MRRGNKLPGMLELLFGVRCLLRKPYQSKNATQGDVLTLVSHVDITWNSFLPYLIQLTNKLEALGFRYVDNKVIILQEKADEK